MTGPNDEATHVEVATFLAATHETIAELEKVAITIENEGLQPLYARMEQTPSSTGLQNMDLLLQGLAELERVLSHARKLFGQGAPLATAIEDIRLELIAAHFGALKGRMPPKLTGADNPVITLFD